jgi:hypothetical protein
MSRMMSEIEISESRGKSSSNDQMSWGRGISSSSMKSRVCEGRKIAWESVPDGEGGHDSRDVFMGEAALTGTKPGRGSA